VLITLGAGLATITGYNLRNLRSSLQPAASSTGSEETTPQIQTAPPTDGVPATDQKHIVRIVETPADLLPLSFPQAGEYLGGRDKSLVEVQQFWKENNKRPVRWEGYTLFFSQSDPTDPNSPVNTLLFPRGVALGCVTVTFSRQSTQDCLHLREGDLIEIQGILESPGTVSDAILLSYVRR
jgi:hypothetical protein